MTCLLSTIGTGNQIKKNYFNLELSVILCRNLKDFLTYTRTELDFNCTSNHIHIDLNFLKLDLEL